MTLCLNTLLWGSVIGIIHFVITGILYQNPVVGRFYKDNETHPGVKKWNSQPKYILSMYLGTQVEVYIITISYIVLMNELGGTNIDALKLALIFTGIRIYPRFWNMWIQSTYPNKLLITEVVNGTISTFVIVFGLYLLPV